MDLSGIGDRIRDALDAKTSARERGMAKSRSAIRSSGNAIRALHRYEWETAAQLLAQAEADLDAAQQALEDHPDILHAGFVHDAEKELAEGQITCAMVRGEPLPRPEDLKVSTQSYLKGMAESIGELRRHILDLMRHGELKRCEELLGDMDDMYYLLVSMDYPDGITMGLRRLTDVARSIIERTRGDYTTSTIQSALRDALEEHASSLQDEGQHRE